MSSIDFPHGNVFFDPAGRARPESANADDRPDRGDLAGQDRSPIGGSSLAGMLAPLRTRLRPVADGHELVIQPMRPVDALGPFTATPAAPARPTSDQLADQGHDGLTPESSTLLLGTGDAGPSLADIADLVRIPLIDRFGRDQLVVDDFSLARLVARPEVRLAAAVRIAGPIEADDARWIQRGLASGLDPLASEVRTVRAMQVGANRTLLVHVRHARDAMRFVAENLRHFLAAVAELPLADVAPPDVGLLVPLFEPSGELSVRPVETDVYSTSVDVGIVTSPPDAPRPADASLIYDLHGSSWHGE